MIVWWTAGVPPPDVLRELRRQGRGVEWPHVSATSFGLAGRERRTQHSGAYREQAAGRSDETCGRSFWNLSDDGRVCTGTMRRPDSASVASIPDWERGFYESAFTHANVGRLTRHEGGFEGLWSGLAGKRTPFPLETLIQLPQTLAQFVRGERG